VRRHSWDLLAVIAVALLSLAVAVVSRGPNPALTAVTLPLVVFLPGYALVALLLGERFLGFPERVALSLGVSIALTVMGGLLLHMLRIPLGAASWRIALAGLTVALAGYGLVRRARGDLAPVGPLAAQMTPREAFLFSAGALVIGLALGLSGLGIARAPGEPFTEFWALGEQVGSRSVVRVGLTNEEGLPMTYRVAVQAGDRLLAEWPEIRLGTAGQWEAEATVPEALLGQQITARAYRAEDPDDQPYRTARIYLDREVRP
jgi:uncharacterized membrane protein